MFRDFVKGVCDLIFPQHCLICKRFIYSGETSRVLCLACQSDIKTNIPPFCPRCSRHMTSCQDNDADLCRECQKTEPLFDHAWGAVIYNPSMRKLIHMFKYGNKLALRHTFIQLMCSFIKTYHIDLRGYDVVVPIPLHAVRMRERGYNQSHILAQMIAQRYHLTLSQNNLIRIKNTHNQAKLSEKERWTNIGGAFKIKAPLEFSQKSVLIIDDLLTTGATTSEAARILKEAKATRVDALTLAIAPIKAQRHLDLGKKQPVGIT